MGLPWQTQTPDMAFSQIEVSEYARKVGKTERTMWRWIKEGCNPRDPKSLREWQVRNQIRETPIERARKRRRDQALKARQTSDVLPPERVSVPTNGDTLPPAGKRGAAAALERLEATEEEAHRRLQVALSRGNAVEIQGAEEFWLRTAETLRRLDLAIEVSRRQEESSVPLRTACDVALYIADWLRIAFAQFLSSETNALMGIRDVGEWKYYAFQRFKGIIDSTVRNSLGTQSAIPDWAAERIKESWNVQE
jgi:hypothetical protein